jgi:hypothetical protein
MGHFKQGNEDSMPLWPVNSVQATLCINITHKMPSECWKCAHRTKATSLKCVLCDFVHPLVPIFIHCCKSNGRHSCPCAHHSGIWHGDRAPFILNLCHGSQSCVRWVTLTSTVNWNFPIHKHIWYEVPVHIQSSYWYTDNGFNSPTVPIF